MSRYGKVMPFYTKIWSYISRYDQDMPSHAELWVGIRYGQDRPSYADICFGGARICSVIGR